VQELLKGYSAVVPTTMTFQGVEATLRGNLLDIRFSQPHQRDEVVEFFRQRIKEIVRREMLGTGDPAGEFAHVHRMSRMCYELLTSSSITNMDSVDAFLLYEAPQEEKFEWVFKILNLYRNFLQEPGDRGIILVADHIAKCVDDVMTS
jgi:hypothetical protein